MLRILAIPGVVIVSLALLPLEGLAQQEHAGAAPAKEHAGEHGGQTAAPSSPPAVTPQPQATAAPEAAPAATPAAPPALKPILITFTGELAELKTDVTPALITVKDRYGVTKEISCPVECKITQGDQEKSLADLTKGAKLTVEYTYDVTTGKRTAQSIVIGEAPPSVIP